MSSFWETPPVLEGRALTIRAVTDADVEGMLHSSRDETMALFTRVPKTRDERGMLDWMHALWSQTHQQMVVIDRASGQILGSSSFFDMSREHRALEIGFTWFDPDVRGTHVNPEAKLLMLEHSFETLKCVRVQLKTDGRNLRSQRAISKLGAKLEGTLRNHKVMPDGVIRDTVMYSLLDSEWPSVKAGLQARLGISSE